MIRSLALFVVVGGLAACISGKPNVISAINYLQESVPAQCAYEAIRDGNGFAVTDSIRPRGTAQQISAFFNDDLPVQILVRNLPNGTAEISAFVQLEKDASPLDRREAVFAVRQADQSIYRSCTADGKSHGGDADLILESKKIK